MYSIGSVKKLCLLLVVALVVFLSGASPAQAEGKSGPKDEVQFPVKPKSLVYGKFYQSEGIAFNGEDDLYVTANSALWRVNTKGETMKLADLYSNLGLAAIGERDVLVADFGPTNALVHGKNNDGIVWRVTTRSPLLSPFPAVSASR